MANPRILSENLNSHMSKDKASYKLHCNASKEIKSNLVEFAKKNGFSGYSGVISEACYLYCVEPTLFKKMDLSPTNDNTKIRNNIQYDTGKYKIYVYNTFKALSEKRLSPISYEFAVFIYKLNFLLVNSKSLPYPKSIVSKFPQKYLDHIVPILRKEKCLIEFYNFANEIITKGPGFEITRDELCKILLLYPENFENYNYVSSIRNKFVKFNSILESKIHIKINGEKCKIWVEKLPHLVEP